MATLIQMSGSTQMVQQEIRATLLGEPEDPAVFPVEMAFMLYPNFGDPPDPGPDDWHAGATWETDNSGLVPSYWAQILVGPDNGGVSLAKGRYRIAVKITTDQQVPILWGWDLTIT